MGTKELEEILERKQKKQDSNLADFSIRKDLWLKSVNEFYQKVVNWLNPFKEKGLLKIEYEKVNKNEQFIGEYEIDKMILTISDDIVRFDPIGTFIIGAYGRIDMIGSNETKRFVLVDSETDRPKLRVEIGTDSGINGISKANIKNQKPKKLEWKISTTPPEIKYSPLNEDSFSDSLIEVIYD